MISKKLAGRIAALEARQADRDERIVSVLVYPGETEDSAIERDFGPSGLPAGSTPQFIHFVDPPPCNE